jgi:hypothetical protein
LRRIPRGLGFFALIPAGVFAAYLYQKSSPKRSVSLWSTLTRIADLCGEILSEYQSVMNRFRNAAPPGPIWSELATGLTPHAVLRRACLHTLCRSRLWHQSAVELARSLPPLSVPQGENKVRETLRTDIYFSQAWAGRWQVGRFISNDTV